MNRRFLLLLVVISAVASGCQPAAAPSTGSPPPRSGDPKSDIHIRTPKANVDIEGKGTGRGVDVNVERKNP
jgi:hypothetical protein